MEYYSAVKRKNIWLSFNEVDEHRAYYTECSKSERETLISYINAYTWNLEKSYWGNYLQGDNGDSDIENRFADTLEEG